MTVRLLHGDVRSVLPTLPAGSVHCVVTSPPYFGLRSYLPDYHPDKALEIGLEADLDRYLLAMVETFREVRRVLREDGVCWLNIGDSYMSGGRLSRDADDKNAAREMSVRPDTPAGLKPKDLMMVPARAAIALQADGWYVRSDIIWSKPNPMPESVTDRPTNSHEHVFLLTKSARYFYDRHAVRQRGAVSSEYRLAQDVESQAGSTRANGGAKTNGKMKAFGDPAGANLRNVWDIATQPYSGAHFATMPIALAERCIRAGTSEKGCCPTCGAPWLREIEKRLVPTPKVSYGSRPDARDAAADAQDQGSNRMKDGHIPGMIRADVTLGWSASCECPPADPVPCTVLDPFGGAGTTALAAARLQRNAVLIELNPASIVLARERLTGDSPLLAEIDTSAAAAGG